MRFGTFVPPSWRLDLAGIEPVDHWPTMLDIAQRAEAGPWESIWVYEKARSVSASTGTVGASPPDNVAPSDGEQMPQGQE